MSAKSESSWKRLAGIAACLLALTPFLAWAQAHKTGPAPMPAQESGSAVLHGCVRDFSGRPIADATVTLVWGTLEQAILPPTETTHTDSEGRYRFGSLRTGHHVLRVEKTGYEVATIEPINLAKHEVQNLDLTLIRTKASQLLSGAPSATNAKAPEFFDEPQFTVAGVTQATSAGGHGSDTVLRNSEALVKATVSLGNESGTAAAPEKPSMVDHSAGVGAAETSGLRKERDELRTQLLRDAGVAPEKQSSLHHQLAGVEEKLGDPLAAVREYQRASELAPKEAHLFDWGSELLAHRALESATEVFAQGNRLYPQSVRMLIGLGVAWYARGSYEWAAQCLGSASDLNPADRTPYLFMGKMQSVETVPSPETMERLARFLRLEPGSALASYYYAVELWKAKQSAGSLDEASSEEIAKLLQKAVELDPKLGAAYLQLGIVYAQRGDYVRAIAAYQKAIVVSPDLEETHYRLAQAYRHTGEEAKAKDELKLHEQLSKQSKEQAERERREIQQFVISLRDKAPDQHDP